MNKSKKLLRKNSKIHKKNQKVGRLEKVLVAFKQLEEPVQTVIVLGILLLLVWIVSNPSVLMGLIKAFQLWLTVTSVGGYLLASE